MNPFEQALSQLARARDVQPLSPELFARLEHPEREVRVSIPVLMDDGSTRFFEGYRVQHSSIRGPYKGGIRFHPQTNIDEVRALALWMTIKCAAANLPMGGGKGGVSVDPKQLSKNELERLSRGWVRALAPILGPATDVPAPDVNTTPEIIGWMADEYAKITGDARGAAFTGKPIAQGGSEGRNEATGMGGFFVFEAVRAAYGLSHQATVAVQGMGNVGGNAARIFAAHRHTVIAISDSKSGIYDTAGLDIEAVEQHKKRHGSLAGFPGAKEISNEELLELPCDILIPAALEDQITKENAARVRARMVLELANGPTTTEADDILFARSIPVVPDVLANAGGVIVSTFEWQQNLAGEHWSETDILAQLEEKLSAETAHILDRAQALNTDLRRAAYAVALERLQQ